LDAREEGDGVEAGLGVYGESGGSE
jgi:hypothetical protein